MDRVNGDVVECTVAGVGETSSILWWVPVESFIAGVESTDTATLGARISLVEGVTFTRGTKVRLSAT